MRQDTLIRLLTHPFFIGFLIISSLWFILDTEPSKYLLELTGKTSTGRNTEIHFLDLDGDRQSEKISLHNNGKILNILVRDGGRLIGQYNLLSFPVEGEFLHAADSDRDRVRELYLLTYRNDSIFLSILDITRRDSFRLEERLVYRSDSVHFTVDLPTAYMTGMDHSRGGQGPDLFFGLSGGFSKQPRRMFRYSPVTDSLTESPFSGVSISYPRIRDVNSDSIPEILVNTAATWNYRNTVPWTDHSNWMMAYTNELEFLFPPVEFKGYPASLQVNVLGEGNTHRILAFHDYYGTDTLPSVLYAFSTKGVLLDSAVLDFTGRGNSMPLVYEAEGIRKIALIENETGELHEYGPELDLLRTRTIPPLLEGIPSAILDINGDGKTEYIFKGIRSGTLVVLDHQLQHPVETTLKEPEYPDHFYLRIHEDTRRLFCQVGDTGVELMYRRNPLYRLQVPMAVAIYLVFSSLLYAVYRIQQNRARKQLNTQNQMLRLQVLSLKNQIDPHFTFNTLNAIGSLYTAAEDKAEAYDTFVRYSHFLRHVLMHSDQATSSLKEEIELVNSYLEIHQTRKDLDFRYEITTDPDVDLQLQIPRMLIHTFAENAIKHGIRHVKESGKLEVNVSRSGRTHTIRVRDNGPGLVKRKEKKYGSTGKGLKIVDELIDLIYQLEGIRIRYTLEEIRTEGSEKAAGTLATIIVM